MGGGMIYQDIDGKESIIITPTLLRICKLELGFFKKNKTSAKAFRQVVKETYVQRIKIWFSFIKTFITLIFTKKVCFSSFYFECSFLFQMVYFETKN